MHRRDLLAGSLTVAGIPWLSLRPAAAEAPATPVRGGVARIAVQEPAILTSAFLPTMNIGMVSSKILEGLVSYDLDLRPVPALAESWETSADGLRVTFHLRREAKWHDGTPFTSADVRFTLLNVWKALHPFGRAVYANVTEVETPDPHTAVVVLSAPALYLFNYINTYGSQILPRHLYEGTDILKNPANAAPIGTGPFRFKEWVRGSHITLERNPDYWQPGKPYLDGIIFRFIPDAVARTVALEAGEIDQAIGSLIPVTSLRRFADTSRYSIATEDGRFLASIFLAQLNVRRPPLSDRRVRQALSHAIDRAALVRLVWQGYGKPATGPIPSSVTQYYWHGTPQAYDPKKAEQLLDEAGLRRGPDGRRFRLNLVNGSGDSLEAIRASEFLKQYLGRVGVDIDIDIIVDEPAAFLRRVYTDANYDIMISSLHRLPDPTLGVQRLYWTRNIIKGAPWTNGSGYSNPELDRIMEAAAAEGDVTRRRALIRRWQDIAQEDVPILDLVELTWTTVSTARLRKLRPQGDGLFAGLEDAWLVPAR
ncbi:ABC transporter substrate-binding protein [Rhodovastum atsumiense]|uniref:ABC transporter substrate-binding protein n=1 Tax=Rhodovastum atsumiense TaxID=504468 RepID=A0A5M6J1S8_9PROT|nr:ABC transporter substrate-binding protein [Rhodovastum atsumiense]KAA5614560.1 ABC transporter substrate-binding protein [Rhodovastum atsumiense]CAH2599950.1 ABC transporter substrate-binding protein [Rhodovastum atsumiense]